MQLKFKKPIVNKLVIIILLTTALTAFYYVHESFPKPLRAITSLLAMPTAVTSGISHYLNLGIPVYDSLTAVIITNGIASIILVYLGNKFLLWRKKRRIIIR